MPKNTFLDSVKGFLYSITTNDHYANYQPNNSSGVQGGRGHNAHRSININRLSSTGSDSLRDEEESTGVGEGMSNLENVSINDPIVGGDSGRMSGSNSNSKNSFDGPYAYKGAFGNDSIGRNSGNYVPGSRSLANAYASTKYSTNDPNGIVLDDFIDGMVPAPPVAVTWKRIEKWLDKNFPELNDEIGDPATAADMNCFESDMDCSFPPDVRESYMIHDGQDRSGQPAGLFFGITSMDLESIEDEWNVWKRVAVEYEATVKSNQANIKSKDQALLNRQSSSSSPASSASAASIARSAANLNVPRPPGPSNNASKKQAMAVGDFIARQESVPEGAIACVYSSAAWVPLAKDYSGNNIAIDLNPGPTGHWGQVILFGHDFDKKYVISPSWAHFLAMFADDLESGNWFIDEDTDEFFYMSNDRAVFYFDVLRNRVERDVKNLKRSQAANAGSSLKTTSVKSSEKTPSTKSSNLKSTNSKLSGAINTKSNGTQNNSISSTANEVSLLSLQSPNLLEGEDISGDNSSNLLGSDLPLSADKKNLSTDSSKKSPVVNKNETIIDLTAESIEDSTSTKDKNNKEKVKEEKTEILKETELTSTSLNDELKEIKEVSKEIKKSNEPILSNSSKVDDSQLDSEKQDIEKKSIDKIQPVEKIEKDITKETTEEAEGQAEKKTE